MGTDTLSTAEGTARAKGMSTPLERYWPWNAGGLPLLRAEWDISADLVKSPVEVTQELRVTEPAPHRHSAANRLVSQAHAQFCVVSLC